MDRAEKMLEAALDRVSEVRKRRKHDLCDDLINKMKRRRRKKIYSAKPSVNYDELGRGSKMSTKATFRSRILCLYSLSVAILLLHVASSSTHCHELSFTNEPLEGLPNKLVNSGMPEEKSQQQQQQQLERPKRTPVAPSMRALLAPNNELRMSGSKNEPPSRPTVDWSKQKPYFGPDMIRNVSVELGKTAYLTCKVYELGDKTVSWLRPRENEILTAGKYTYIGDPRFASINDNGSHDWILEIKDVGLNDSTSYECQVSTDPKMSTIINLHVKAAKARIKQGEQFYAPHGSNIEFTCEVGQKSSIFSSSASPNQSSAPSSAQQTYWYFNGNLLNYARTHAVDKNFSIDWDPMTQLSRFKLFNVQMSDAGNYTCKPTSSEPATIRLHVKRFNKNNIRDRAHNNGFPSTKEAQKNRQHHGVDANNNLELMESNNSDPILRATLLDRVICLLITCLVPVYLLTYHPH